MLGKYWFCVDGDEIDGLRDSRSKGEDVLKPLTVTGEVTVLLHLFSLNLGLCFVSSLPVCVSFLMSNHLLVTICHFGVDLCLI